MSRLPDDFRHPERVDLPTGHHLRPIRADDVDIEYPAVMGSRERLWVKSGEAWGWPPAHMTPEGDREDLLHHQEEIAAHIAFNYAGLDEGETELLGCVYIDPPDDGSPGRSAASTTRRRTTTARSPSRTANRGFIGRAARPASRSPGRRTRPAGAARRG